MVELTLSNVLQILQTTGILVGIIYYIMTLQNTRKNQKISLRNQAETLKTRHATIYSQTTGPLFTPEGVKNILLLQNNPFSNIEEWRKIISTNIEFYEAWVWFCNMYENVGVNITEGVTSIDFFARHNPWYTLDFWRQSKPIIYELRKQYGPSFYRNMEYFMDSMEKYFEEHPELAP